MSRSGAAEPPATSGVAVSPAAQARGAEDEHVHQRARAAGIHAIAVPTPFQVGRVNAYLIEDEPLTLIDSGPNSAQALDELEQALQELGHAVEELELLIISHQHIDHFGLASVLARRSGAEVAALDCLAPYLRGFSREAELDDRYAEQMMLRHGIAPDVATALRSVSESFRGWGSAVPVTRPLSPGQELRLRDRTLRVLHRPGHSPSDTVFVDERRAIMFAADHLIAHVSSNPLIARPLGSGETAAADPRPQALVTYLESMGRTRDLELRLVLSGHGGPITDHRALIDERLRLHARRARKIRDLLERPLTAHEVAQRLWGNVAVTQAYLTLSEVLGHMDLLTNEGLVVESPLRGVMRFQAC